MMNQRPIEDLRVGFIGCGNMAEAILRCITSSGLIRASSVFASDPSPERRALFASAGCTTGEDNQMVAKSSDILLLAVKPQVIEEVCRGLAPAVDERLLVVSIAAGVTLSRLEECFAPSVRVVRVMPNTPMIVGRGLSGISKGSKATALDAELVLRIFAAGGFAFEVKEEDLHAVTALSGSGPAYVFRFIEALAQAGVEAGLSSELSSILARGTVAGASQLLLESGEEASRLRERVTSKGGTTAAALQCLTENNFDRLIIDALLAAKSRSIELSLHS